VEIKQILVTTDLSEASVCALEAADTMARKFGASVTALTVLNFDADLPPGVLSLSPDKEAALKREIRGKVEDKLEKLCNAAFGDDVTLTREVLEDGGAAETIARYAGDHDADLLVISTHGRTGLSHLLLGSVAERVVRTAPCPVMTIRPTRKD
jgi:nucleotide-binding universal stress UspA family protein